MARPPILVGPGIGYPFETGARIYAALAFPGVDEDAARENAEIAWIASWLHKQNAVDENDAPFVDQRLNCLSATSPRVAKAQLRTSMRRLRDRSATARAIRPWVRELMGLGPSSSSKIFKKPSQRQIAIFIEGPDLEKAIRFEERKWRPSRPVLHLAAAMDLIASYFHLPDSLGISLDNVAFFCSVIEVAQILQPIFALDPRFKVSAEEQLSFIWENSVI